GRFQSARVRRSGLQRRGRCPWSRLRAALWARAPAASGNAIAEDVPWQADCAATRAWSGQTERRSDRDTRPKDRLRHSNPPLPDDRAEAAAPKAVLTRR